MRDRVIETSDYIIETKATVRQASKVFCISKSTVHKDMTERLFEIDKERYKKVKKILGYNLSIRHIRGGLATKKKYNKDFS